MIEIEACREAGISPTRYFEIQLNEGSGYSDSFVELVGNLSTVCDLMAIEFRCFQDFCKARADKLKGLSPEEHHDQASTDPDKLIVICIDEAQALLAGESQNSIPVNLPLLTKFPIFMSECVWRPDGHYF